MEVIAKQYGNKTKKIVKEILNNNKPSNKELKDTIITKIKVCLKKDGLFKSIKKGIKYFIRISKRRR